MEYRIVKVEDDYLLQMKTFFGWIFVRGYHRGAPGIYNHEIEDSSNPFYLVHYSIPEVEKEQRNPTLSYYYKHYGRFIRPPNPKRFTVVYTDMTAIQRIIDKHLSDPNYSVINPWPKLESIKDVLCNVSDSNDDRNLSRYEIALGHAKREKKMNWRNLAGSFFKA